MWRRFSPVHQFGERHPDYPFPVINEREARAGAGLLFVVAMVSFLNAFLVGDFVLTKLFVMVFFLDFLIRVLVHPRYAPSLILGRWFVRNQVPEYVGASQKQFAWAVGLGLGAAMLWLLVINDVRGPVNLLMCGSWLLLLFFETAFGICLGCWFYHKLFKNAPQQCPGGACLSKGREPIQTFSKSQGVVMIVFVALVGFMFSDHQWIRGGEQMAIGVSETQLKVKAVKECAVPDWAIALGHEEKYRRHQCGE